MHATQEHTQGRRIYRGGQEDTICAKGEKREKIFPDNRSELRKRKESPLEDSVLRLLGLARTPLQHELVILHRNADGRVRIARKSLVRAAANLGVNHYLPINMFNKGSFSCRNMRTSLPTRRMAFTFDSPHTMSRGERQTLARLKGHTNAHRWPRKSVARRSTTSSSRLRNSLSPYLHMCGSIERAPLCDTLNQSDSRRTMLRTIHPTTILKIVCDAMCARFTSKPK